MTRRDPTVSLFDKKGAIRPLADVERDAILHALEVFDGNASATARALGITRMTIYRRLAAEGLSVAEIREGK